MYTPMDHINTWKENQKSPYFAKKERKIIHHPGEVRLSSCPLMARAGCPHLLDVTARQGLDAAAPASLEEALRRLHPPLYVL
jgi:hypothetical protein